MMPTLQEAEPLSRSALRRLIDLKVVEQEPEGHALEQIKARGYAEKHRASGQPIHLIGVEFSREQRTRHWFSSVFQDKNDISITWMNCRHLEKPRHLP